MSKRQTKEWAKSCMWPVLYVFELKKFFHFKVVFKKKKMGEENSRGTIHGLQSLKYLLPSPLQKNLPALVLEHKKMLS